MSFRQSVLMTSLNEISQNSLLFVSSNSSPSSTTVIREELVIASPFTPLFSGFENKLRGNYT